MYRITDQALIIHCSVKIFLAIRHLLSITAFCMRLYRPRRRLSNFKLSCNLFRIIPVANSTVVTGMPGARRRPVSLALFNIVFSTQAAPLLDSVCSFGVLDEGAPSGIWPVRDFGEVIVLVFLLSIFSAQVESISAREQGMCWSWLRKTPCPTRTLTPYTLIITMLYFTILLKQHNLK
jgi:hypothetical protein